MRVPRLVSPFPLLLVLLLLSSYALLPSDQAYARKPCCTWCGQMFCTPPGVGNCPWFACLTDDTDMLQAQIVMSNAILAIGIRSDSQSSPTVRPTSIDRLITLPNLRRCARNNFALRLFQSDVDHPKRFASDFPKYNASHNNNLVAFQIGTEKEK